MLQALFEYIKDNNITVEPAIVFKLAEIREAHAYLDSADSFGKVVVVNDWYFTGNKRIFQNSRQPDVDFWKLCS